MKRLHVRLSLALLFVMTVATTIRSYAQYDRIIPICIDTPVFPPIHIPVGCEVVDCCPGCPGPPIDWTIYVKGDPGFPIQFKVSNLGAAELKALKVSGSAKLVENNILRIEKGKAVIAGFPRDAKGRSPVLTPTVQLDADALGAMQKRSADPDGTDKDLGSVEITIQQMVGDYIVNDYQFLYVFRRCYWPPVIRLTDKIVLNNNTSGDNAVALLDARRSAGCVDDQVQRGTGPINVGSVLSNGTCQSEVAILSDDNAMELISPVRRWTDPLGDVLTVNMRPLLQMPVTVWLMIPGQATLNRAQADIANANLLYNSNNAGISFNATYTDVSGNANAANVITNNFGCNAAEITALTGSAFFTPNRINVYYIDRAFTGFNCIAVRNIVFIGTTSNNQSLAHEFGHSMSLGHTNGLAGFTPQNLMIGGGAGRTNITDGQAFRCNVNATSTLNTNGVRTGITRNCPDGTTSTTCPALTLNITPK